MRITDPRDYEIYALGHFGRRIVGDRLFKKFILDVNVADCEYDPDLSIWLSFDFNVQPYCSATVYQIHQEGDSKVIRCIDEIITTYPQNNTTYICTLFKQRYANHVAGLLVTGDPANRKEDTRSEQGFNDYSIIETALESYYPNIYLLPKHTAVATSVNFTNALLCESFDDLRLFIAPRCEKLIDDLMYLKEASEAGDNLYRYYPLVKCFIYKSLE